MKGEWPGLDVRRAMAKVFDAFSTGGRGWGTYGRHMYWQRAKRDYKLVKSAADPLKNTKIDEEKSPKKE